MALALLVLGILLVISGARGTAGALGNQVASDFSGSGSFVYWMAAIVLIGALGYSPPLKRFSNYLLALIFVVFVVKNGGVFTQIQSALSTTRSEPNDSPSGVASSSSSGSGSNPVSSALGIFGDIGGLFGGF